MGFDATLFERLAETEPRSFWFRARNRLIVSMFRRHFPDCRDFLEIGTGTGYVLAELQEAFPGVRFVGSDLYPEGLAFARERLPGVELLELDARTLPFREAFDVVGAFDVLEHIEEDNLVLEQLRTSLRPGGGAIVLVPQHPQLWSKTDELSRHVRRYTRDELIGKLKRAGFTPERVSSFVTTLLPMMGLSRWLETSPCRELAPGALNGPLGLVLDGERWLIEHGVSLPVGGSLLVVCRRNH